MKTERVHEILCPICYNVFDSKLRKEIQLACGHHLCISCLNNIKKDGCVKCPFDLKDNVLDKKMPEIDTASRKRVQPVCPSTHQGYENSIKLSYTNNKQFTCTFCNKVYSDIMHCPACKYAVCKHCYLMIHNVGECPFGGRMGWDDNVCCAECGLQGAGMSCKACHQCLNLNGECKSASCIVSPCCVNKPQTVCCDENGSCNLLWILAGCCICIPCFIKRFVLPCRTCMIGKKVVCNYQLCMKCCKLDEIVLKLSNNNINDK